MRIYVGDIGTTLTIDAGADISTQTSLQLRIKKPDNTILVMPAVLSGSNNAVVVSDVSTFTIAGEYVCNLLVTLPVGQWTGETFTLQVYEVEK